MAHAGHDTGGSQFFITLVPCPWLDGLYVNSGHGSRGLITAPLAGEALAAALHGDPAPLPGPLLEALHPNRFLLRAQKRRHAPERRP